MKQWAWRLHYNGQTLEKTYPTFHQAHLAALPLMKEGHKVAIVSDRGSMFWLTGAVNNVQRA